MKYLTAGILILAMTAGLAGCWQPEHSYSAEPLFAQVVDADTGKPIAGVAVVAQWEMYQGSITGDGMPCGAANVEEAVTGKDGWFYIPGWGPVRGKCGYMRNGNPRTFLFKPGYEYAYVPGGDSLNVVQLIAVARVLWNGTTIKMQKFPNLDLRAHGRGSYADNFDVLNSELDMFVVDMPAECNWKKIPYMLKLIIAQTKAFIAAGNTEFNGSISLTLSRPDQDKFMRRLAPHCGSPKAFVGRLAQ